MADQRLDEIVFIVQEEPEDGGYSAVCHPYGIFTQGDDLDDLRTMVVDAVEGRFADEPVKPGRIRHDLLWEAIEQRLPALIGHLESLLPPPPPDPEPDYGDKP